MTPFPAVAVLGTFDSKGEEHRFLKERIEQRGTPAVTIHVGTKGPSPFHADYDLYRQVILPDESELKDRDRAIAAVITKARELVRDLYHTGRIGGLVSAGGGTGTHIAASIMSVLPLGVPKVIVSTVASRDMKPVVGTKDITMIHSVADILGINSITGRVLDRAAGAVSGMVRDQWQSSKGKKRIALTMFGFITSAAEAVRTHLEAMDYEVVAFHANGTGGMAMEELAREGYFDGILDLATHELADELMHGYCRGIGPQRLEPPADRAVPRLVVPGGLDCAVLEFTRASIPEAYKERDIFFYDFRSAIRLSLDETRRIARQLADKLNQDISDIGILVPMRGWSEADGEGRPLYDLQARDAFMEALRQAIHPQVPIEEVDLHINDPAFAETASTMMHRMMQRVS